MGDLLERLQSALAGRYAVDRELGQGGMASVFLARDLKHGRPVAVKVLLPELARTVGPDRFLREIEIAAGLTHPHILPVFDSGAADSFLYYVMPYIEGETLRHRLQREQRLPLADALRIAREIAEALDYAHRQGIVHRDVKPENVLLEDGHAVVADFGIARALASAGEARLTRTGLPIGTPAYMSPEQASGDQEVDGRSDVYALACVLYEMLAGAPPFQGPSYQNLVRQHLMDPPPHVAALRPEVSEGVQAIIERALAKSPADRFATAAAFAAALAADATGPPPGGARPRRPRVSRLTAGLVAGLVALAAAALWVRQRAGTALDGNLVAVAPFDVLVPGLELWREGLVDVLSRDLDGAGPLRTVAPTIVVRRWHGRADAPSAAALGRATGARLTVFGQVLGAGGDSVRVSATLYDLLAGRALGEFQILDAGDRIDRVADSLTMALLRELGRRRPIGAVRLASIGSRSLPALKAFLQGEQFYRRTDWDSALVYYQRAIELDSTFAPALRRMGLAIGWQRSGFDSLSRAYHLRAGAFNHGLAPRESLLVAADSISAALYAYPVGPSRWSQQRRLFATLDEATRRYPNDPEAWYALGDARFHFGFGPGFGVTEREILAPFDRAIALDSAFGPSYIHPVALGLTLDGPALAERYAHAYLALDPKDVNAQGIRVMDQLIELGGDARGRERVLDTAPAEALRHAWSTTFAWPDSAETAIAVARAMQRRARGSDTLAVRFPVALTLLFRGHLREVLREASPQARGAIAEAAVSGALPRDSVSRLFARWFRRDTFLNGEMARWWVSTRDTAMLAEAIARLDAVARGEFTPPTLATLPRDDARGVARYMAQALRGYAPLARGDTVQALARFAALPDTVCHVCALDRLTHAQLLAARGQDAAAATILDRHRFGNLSALQGGVWALERARVHERLGDRTQALEDYRFVADVWRHADPELLPLAAEARAALRRLAAEPKP